MRELFINDDGLMLHGKLDKPEGLDKCPLCIVIHGLTGHMEETHIKGVCHALNDEGIATLRVEMYGHGKSEGRFEDHDLFKWIENALAAVSYARKLDFVTDLYLCGHSQGGLLTVLVAGMMPEAFKAIIPMSPALNIPAGCRRGNLLGIDLNNMPDYIDLGPAKLSSNYVRIARMIHAEDSIDKYTGPVLIVHGDQDEAVPLDYSWKAAYRYKNCKLVVIPGDDHCYTRHLDQVTSAIREFVRQLN